MLNSIAIVPVVLYGGISDFLEIATKKSIGCLFTYCFKLDTLYVYCCR